MRKYKKPEINVKIISDINEPVYMACSGKNLFDMNWDGYRHQVYEEGRDDVRFQIDGTYLGSAYSGNIYLTATFDQPVNVTGWGWHFETYSDPTGSYTVIGVAESIYLNEGPEGIGFGDLYVALESGGSVGDKVTMTSLTVSLSPDGCA